jgi:hypothetical protein
MLSQNRAQNRHDVPKRVSDEGAFLGYPVGALSGLIFDPSGLNMAARYRDLGSRCMVFSAKEPNPRQKQHAFNRG